MCNDGSVEDEMHFIFVCEKLEKERENMTDELKTICDLDTFVGIDKLKRMLEPDCLKVTANHLIVMLERRKELMYS